MFSVRNAVRLHMDLALAEKSRADPLKSSAKIFACHLQNLEKIDVTFLLWLGTIVKEVALD